MAEFNSIASPVATTTIFPPILLMPPNADLDLAAEIATYYNDMLGAALFLYPWGKAGTPLEFAKGPSREQAKFLDDLSAEIQARKFDGVHPVKCIRMLTTSGHGTGKTELIGMLAGILMSTRDAMRGTVTANNGQQLSTKTWASIQKYKKLLICAHWFEITSEKFWRVGRKDDWQMNATTWTEENADAFQGQHSARSTSVYIFDEDSNIPQTIHTAAEGGTIHGEAMYFRFGNCTRRDGPFYQTAFGTNRNAWLNYTLGPSKDTPSPSGIRRWDATETEFRSDEQNKEWAEEYGEDSDFFRVRVRGLPPTAGDMQFISSEAIHGAQKRIAAALSDDPLIAGCDLSWGGFDPACIRFRRGMDARSIPSIRIPASETKDDAMMVMKLSEVLSREWNGRKVEMLFIDSAGTCGNICRRLRELGHRNIIEVNFGGHAPNKKYKLMRSFMWGEMKDAMPYMAIDISPDLEADLQAPGYTLTRATEILLEEKRLIIKRLGRSTDDGDALALTFAMPVKSKQSRDEKEKRRRQSQQSVGVWS